MYIAMISRYTEYMHRVYKIIARVLQRVFSTCDFCDFSGMWNQLSIDTDTHIK